jgi:hypothetical protein
MGKLGILLLGILLALPAWAEDNLESLLNRVSLQLHTEQWLTTKTALVDVGINAAVTDQGIEKIQANAMQKLNQLSDKGEWHILYLNRQLDKSGLESIQIGAQARLPQDELSNLRNKAKTLSRPGETFTVDNVQFTPSEDEVKQANIAMRNNLYLQAKAEIDTLNKLYPDQKFYLHQIMFNTQLPMAPMPMMNNAMSMERPSLKAIPMPLPIGNKAELQAMVVIASTPDVLTQKAVMK